MSFTVEMLTYLSNQVKETVVSALCKEGVLTEEQATTINQTYAIVLHKKGTLGSFIAKLFGMNDSELGIHLVKLVK
jgi:hypothetical protein